MVHSFLTDCRLDRQWIVWAKVSRHSDAVFQALRIAKANFAELVCPRSREEVGVRVEGMDASLKTLPTGRRRVTLRASDVPLALMATLHLVVARIDGSLRWLASLVLKQLHPF